MADASNVEIPPRNISSIKNKQRRRAEFVKLKKEKSKLKKQQRLKRRKEEKELGDKAPPKQVPRTIENTREYDETTLQENDPEVEFDQNTDEMAAFYSNMQEPKVLITTSDNPHTRTNRLCKELSMVIPNSMVRWRKRSSVKKIVKRCIENEFTDVIVINEDGRHPNAMLLIHLPEGPTAYFRMSNVKFSTDIKNHGSKSTHRPEVIFNNFNTRLGLTICRMFSALFHREPQFNGRNAVTFHNQRDYIFFRHHRYQFRNEKKVGLQELGPRFTLRLKSLQKGTFDSKFGEFEWELKRHEMETSRRRFFL